MKMNNNTVNKNEDRFLQECKDSMRMIADSKFGFQDSLFMQLDHLENFIGYSMDNDIVKDVMIIADGKKIAELKIVNRIDPAKEIITKIHEYMEDKNFLIDCEPICRKVDSHYFVVEIKTLREACTFEKEYSDKMEVETMNIIENRKINQNFYNELSKKIADGMDLGEVSKELLTASKAIKKAEADLDQEEILVFNELIETVKDARNDNQELDLNKTLNNIRKQVKEDLAYRAQMQQYAVLAKTEETIKKNIAHNIQKQISTYSGFMDFLAEGYGIFMQENKSVGVGKMTVAGDTMAQVLLITNPRLFTKLARKALSFVFPKLDLNNPANKGKKFNSLFVDQLMLKDKKLGFIVMSKTVERAIIHDIHNCDLNDAENLEKIFRVINDCFRMYQELTIDAAKKLYEVSAVFYQEIFRAESTIHFSHRFTGFKNLATDDEAFAIWRQSSHQLDEAVNVGEYQEFYNNSGKIKKVLFRDELGQIQNNSAKALENTVRTTGLQAYQEAVLSDETVKKLGLVGPLREFIMDIFELIIKPYNALIADKAQKQAAMEKDILSDFSKALVQQRIDEEYKEGLATISNLARYYTRNLSMVDAGRVIFAASYITVTNQEIVYKEDSTNTAYLHVAPELFYAYFTAEHAEMKVCGYELLGNIKAAGIEVGDELSFLNGNAVLNNTKEVELDDIHVNSDFTGILTVEEINGKISVVIDTVQFLEENRIPHTTPDHISIRMLEHSVIDCQTFAKTKQYVKTGKFETLKNQLVLEKAEKFTLMPIFSYTDDKGVRRTLNRAIVATIPSLNGSKKHEIPVAQFMCRSAMFEKEIAGLTSKTLKIAKVDGRTAWCKVEYGTFEDVELCLAKPQENAFDNIVNADNYNFEIVEHATSVAPKDDAFADVPQKDLAQAEVEEALSASYDESVLGANYEDYADEYYDTWYSDVDFDANCDFSQYDMGAFC